LTIGSYVDFLPAGVSGKSFAAKIVPRRFMKRLIVFEGKAARVNVD
jgi:hypothetical protein